MSTDFCFEIPHFVILRVKKHTSQIVMCGYVQKSHVERRIKMNASKTKLQIILSHTCTYFNFLNLVLASLIIFSGQYKHMLFMGIVISNSLIGIIQECKVKKLIDNLSVITATKASLVTEDGVREIPIENIRIGNVLRVTSGEQIAADATVMTSDGLEVNESLLTGESVPVLKKKGDTLFSGSYIVAGSGTCEVIHVGEDNYATQLIKKAKTKKRASSEMQYAINKIIRYVSVAIVPIGFLLFFIQYYRAGSTLADSLVSTVAGVLGMIPEGLVLLTSISFILGVGRLAGKRALVQEMEAIEALARVNVLCLDKTGTITTGELTAEQVELLDSSVSMIEAEQILRSVVCASPVDNLTSRAIKEYLGPDNSSQKQPPVADFVPFSSRRKFMGIALADNSSYVLGAPEFLTHDPGVLARVEQLGKKGLRVLLLASCQKLSHLPDELLDVKPIALVTLADQIKENSAEIFHFFASQGVEIKILSGDNPATASAVAAAAGIPRADDFMDASSLEGTSPEELKDIITRYTVWGRVSPEMKQALIKAYQQNGKTVGMVGDGVNDVLALKDADCGIAMANGADAARQSAHIVLLDSDFSSMQDIVKEGRTIISNIERVSALYLTKTIYSILLCIIFIIIGRTYPFIPIQLSLIGAAAIGLPSFVLTLEKNPEPTPSGFLRHVLRISLPAALLLTVSLVVIQYISDLLALSALFVRSLNLLAGGVISLSVVVRVCMPMSRTRMLLCIGVTALFFSALILFPDLFNIYSIL